MAKRTPAAKPASKKSRKPRAKKLSPSRAKRKGQTTLAEDAHEVVKEMLAVSEGAVVFADKHERFAAEYVVDQNAKQAAIRAGYSPASAHVTGSRLLNDAKVQSDIAERQARIAEKLEITAEMVARELARIGFSDIRRAIKWRTNVKVFAQDQEGENVYSEGNVVELIGSDDIDADTASAIAEISQTDKGAIKVKFHDKQAALVSLGKHLGMFRDQVDLTINDGLASQLEHARRRFAITAPIREH